MLIFLLKNNLFVKKLFFCSCPVSLIWFLPVVMTNSFYTRAQILKIRNYAIRSGSGSRSASASKNTRGKVTPHLVYTFQVNLTCSFWNILVQHIAWVPFCLLTYCLSFCLLTLSISHLRDIDPELYTVKRSYIYH